MKHINESLKQKLMSIYNDKYEITSESTNINGRPLYRIKALRNIPRHKVKVGDLGGWIESYYNLDQKGDCWVADDAKVYDDAIVCDNALVYDNANIYGYAEVFDNANVYGDANVADNARVYNNAEVCGRAIVAGQANVFGNAEICGNAKVDYKINSGKITK